MNDNFKKSWLIKLISSDVYYEDKFILRVYSEKDRDAAKVKLEEYYDKYSDYIIDISEEKLEKFEYESLDELLAENWL